MQIAEAVPEFGGAFSDTVLKVYLIDLAAAPRVREVLDHYNQFGTRGKEVRFLLGKYSFRQLAAWARCFQSQPVPDVSMFGIDERANRVFVGVASDSGMQRAQQAIRRLQLPLEAFRLERQDYARVGYLGRKPIGHTLPKVRWLTSE